MNNISAPTWGYPLWGRGRGTPPQGANILLTYLKRIDVIILKRRNKRNKWNSYF